MALTLQIPLSIIADSFVRGALYSPMFNIGAICIFTAFIFVTIATQASMPRTKIKVPRKVRHFCCCTCHGCKRSDEDGDSDGKKISSPGFPRLAERLFGFFKAAKSDNSTEMKTLLTAGDSSDED